MFVAGGLVSIQDRKVRYAATTTSRVYECRRTREIDVEVGIDCNSATGRRDRRAVGPDEGSVEYPPSEVSRVRDAAEARRIRIHFGDEELGRSRRRSRRALEGQGLGQIAGRELFAA